MTQGDQFPGNIRKARERKKITHQASKLRSTLQGHWQRVYKIALSHDGNILASHSSDYRVSLWDIRNGYCIGSLNYILDPDCCLSWSPDGNILASAGLDNFASKFLLYRPDKSELDDSESKIILWNTEGLSEHRPRENMFRCSDIEPRSFKGQSFIGHMGIILDLAWSQDGKILASSSSDRTIRLWESETGQILYIFEGHTGDIYSIAWSPDGKRLCSGSSDMSVRLWNTRTGREIWISTGHRGGVTCVAWSPDGSYVVSGSEDCTIRIWHPENGKQMHVLEGHTDKISSISFVDYGRYICTHARDGGVILWQTETWEQVPRECLFGTDNLAIIDLAINPTFPVMAVVGKKNQKRIDIFDLDISTLHKVKPIDQLVHYINAKVVLLGDSGVGKSGLGIRMSEKTFRLTESTHGAQFWHFPADRVPDLPPNLKAEITLWDLAGQPEYRLVHQLFLDDTDAAMLLFDCSDPNEPFRGVSYWAKVLKKQAPIHAVKFLVSARCDVCPVTVDRDRINHMLAKYNLHEYIKTSAKKGEGVEQLSKRIMESISWKELPRTTTPRLFQIVREFILEIKNDGKALLSMEVILQEVEKRYMERIVTQPEINTVIALLQARGLVHRLDPRPDTTFVLTRPELINQYASSIIQAARNHPLGVGAVLERNILIGAIPLSGFERLTKDEEVIVLEATAEPANSARSLFS